jgi:hypothetical protein
MTNIKKMTDMEKFEKAFQNAINILNCAEFKLTDEDIYRLRGLILLYGEEDVIQEISSIARFSIHCEIKISGHKLIYMIRKRFELRNFSLEEEE